VGWYGWAFDENVPGEKPQNSKCPYSGFVKFCCCRLSKWREMKADARPIAYN
jgi:hypothetical protein